MIERWENSIIDLFKINRELNFKLSILVDNPSYSFYNKKDKDRFGLKFLYKTFVNLYFNPHNENSGGYSVSFTIEQFMEFLIFLENIYKNFFKSNGVREDGSTNYKHFVYNKDDNRFLVKSVSMNIRKRFNNTCLRKNIDFMLGTSDLEDSPKVGVLMIFSENYFSFIKRVDLEKTIKYFNNIDLMQLGLNLYNTSYKILCDPNTIERPKANEDTKNRIEELKIKMMASKKELKQYCIENKIEFNKEDFESNDLKSIKEAVISYINGE